MHRPELGPPPGARHRSELTPRQAEELRWSAIGVEQKLVNDGHHARTIRSLVAKGYLRWTLADARAFEITDDGHEWIRRH